MLNLEVFLAMGHLIIKSLQQNRAWKMFVDNMFLKITLFQNLLIFFANLRFFVFSKLFFNIFLKHYRDKSKKHLFSNETATLSCKRYTPVIRPLLVIIMALLLQITPALSQKMTAFS